jgi:aldose 1-epimerase
VVAASGEQHVLSYSSSRGVLRAVIAQVGASLREFTIGDIELVEPYAEDQYKPLCAGTVMAPWVNRLDGGKWTHQGKVLQNNITIVDQQNANHGLLLDYPYGASAKTESLVTLEATITPREGYPFLLQTSVTYELGENGLTVTHRATNLSREAAPYATGAHPYFKFSAVETADLKLFSDAQTQTVVDARQIPVSTRPTAGTEFDFRNGIRVGDGRIDEDFTDLPLDENGHSHFYLKADDGRGLDVWQDATFKHVVIFTPANFPAADGRPVHAAAIEPSTAAPNAFNSGVNLAWLEPGVEFEARWGVSVTL